VQINGRFVGKRVAPIDDRGVFRGNGTLVIEGGFVRVTGRRIPSRNARVALGFAWFVALICVAAYAFTVAYPAGFSGQTGLSIPVIVFAALAVGGAAWMAVMATFNTATQTSAPPWVRSRAVALHTVSALGSFAIGSALWGMISGVGSLEFALCLAAATMLGGISLGRWFPLRMGVPTEVTPGALWEDLLIKDPPLPDDGPVAVETSYRIRATESREFLDAIGQLRAARRRDGAIFWRVYRDLQDSSRYLERFIVASWADYLHQRARATLADQELEARVRAFLREGEVVNTQHYIAER